MEDMETSQNKPISPVMDSACETPRAEPCSALTSEVETEFNRYFEMRDAVRKTFRHRRESILPGCSSCASRATS